MTSDVGYIKPKDAKYDKKNYKPRGKMQDC